MLDQIGSRAGNIPEPRKAPINNSRNIDHGQEEISGAEELFEGAQQLVKLGVISTETFTTDYAPQNVDSRSVQLALHVDHRLRMRLALGADLIGQLGDFIEHHIFKGLGAKTKVTQVAQRESALLTPQFTVSEYDTCQFTNQIIKSTSQSKKMQQSKKISKIKQ